MKERISLIVKKPKMRMYTLIVVMLVSIFCIGCIFTGAKNDKNNDKTELDISTENTEESDNSVNSIESETIENVLFYESLSEDMLITDVEVNNRVLQLLQDEKKLIDTIESSCAMNFEERIQVDGAFYYRVLETDSWSYYENIARNYYSEDYFQEKFVKKYLEEHKLFVEENGKLYRAAADGITVAFIKGSEQVWKVDKDTYYVTILAYSVGGGYFTEGYRICPSEHNPYGFEIVDKPFVESNKKKFFYSADLIDDGIAEEITVSIIDGNEEKDTRIKIRVYNTVTSTLLYETEMQPRSNLGEEYYINSYKGQKYLMHYKLDIESDKAVYEYEVFHLSETGKKILYDTNTVEISFTNVEEVDIGAWKTFAEEKHMYFDDACLLMGTYGQRLEYSTDIEMVTYLEDLQWLLVEDDMEDIAKDLDILLKEIQSSFED